MRYHRQLILFGKESQDKLFKSKVLIVGLGGLGSAVAYYLASSGIGYIGLVDPDIVELSNLQRQILHNEEHIGMPKVISAMINLKRFNSKINILPYPEEINKKNVFELIDSYDIVVACPDNFQTRFILNEACFRLKKPLVIGAASEFEGHVLNVIPPEGPCYNCIFGDAIEQNSVQGILAPVAGLIGCIQAIETLKILLSIGKILHGRMLIYDAFNNIVREVKFLKNPSCLCCNGVKD